MLGSCLTQPLGAATCSTGARIRADNKNTHLEDPSTQQIRMKKKERKGKKEKKRGHKPVEMSHPKHV